ncbi:MAG TPA: response regulator transcription factor, partial [Candidatus Limnocylindrales bacterium]
MKILLIEDDPRLSRSLARLLEGDRHNVEVADDGESGLEIALGENGIDVVILDVGLPDVSGLEVAREIRRERRELAILMLTARDTIGDRVTGLDAGADDYVVKPFSYDELAARLRARARRPDTVARRPEPRLTAGPISLDEASRTVTVHERAVDLSPREFSLLESLLRHPGQALS